MALWSGSSTGDRSACWGVFCSFFGLYCPFYVSCFVGGYFMYVIFAAAVFLTCSQQHVVDVLAVASLGTCSATAAVAAAA